MTDHRSGDDVIDQIARRDRHTAYGTPIDVPLTDDDRAEFLPQLQLDSARTLLPPEGGSPPSRTTKVLAVVLAVCLLALVLTFLIPIVMWVVGNVVIPFWHWGTSWL